jgi:hypothetical protein
MLQMVRGRLSKAKRLWRVYEFESSLHLPASNYQNFCMLLKSVLGVNIQVTSVFSSYGPVMDTILFSLFPGGLVPSSSMFWSWLATAL